MDFSFSGVVYIIQDALQFWSELTEIVHIIGTPTLEQLDTTLRRFLSFCAAYHEQYLQSPLQLEYACDVCLKSDLFKYHSSRMYRVLIDDAVKNTDPHLQMIMYNVMLACGRSDHSFFRSQERWHPLLPWLIDHVREIDPVEDGLHDGASGSISRAISIPIEAQQSFSAVKLLYEVCRFQNMTLQTLKVFDDSFIAHLFELVEQTRDMDDETFNYLIIKLIVALNERFMVAALDSPIPRTPDPQASEFTHQQSTANSPDITNRVLTMLTVRRRLYPTFGVNLIFMLNRAERTPEDLCMQLLVLKCLYLLFTTKNMADYFYTNDLCVLVDVFLREIVNVDDESLRHTYLRVLHPLLTKTQLRDHEYKRPDLLRMLQSLIANASIREIDPTTKRLVKRCMDGDWCARLEKMATASPTGPSFKIEADDNTSRGASPAAVSYASTPHSAGVSAISGALPPHIGLRGSVRGQASRSVEHIPLHSGSHQKRAVSAHHQRILSSGHSGGPAKNDARSSRSTLRTGSGDSFPLVATAATSPTSQARTRGASLDMGMTEPALSALSLDERATPASGFIPSSLATDGLHSEVRGSPTSPQSVRLLSMHRPSPTHPSDASSTSSAGSTSTVARRRPPPPPLKSPKQQEQASGRRKPPAPPASRKQQVDLNSGLLPVSITAASSQPNLLTFSRRQ